MANDNDEMKYAGSGKPIPITDPEDQARVTRVEQLAAITGPPNKAACAICRSPDTTDDVYGVKDRDNATGEETSSRFHLCAACVPILEADMIALRRLGLKGVH